MGRFKTRQFGVGGFSSKSCTSTSTKSNCKEKKTPIQKEEQKPKKPVKRTLKEEKIKNDSTVSKKAKVEKDELVNIK